MFTKFPDYYRLSCFWQILFSMSCSLILMNLWVVSGGMKHGEVGIHYIIGMSLQQYLKVVICFIILTDLTTFLLKFCVDEVFEERGVTDMRRIRRGKSSSLGMPKAPQVNISSILKHKSLGMPRLASHLSSSTIIGITSVLFCAHDLCPMCFFL